MEHRNYMGYKVYENGDTTNSDGVILKPKIKKGIPYYKIKGKLFSTGRFILFAFEIYPRHVRGNAKRKDGNPMNNSLSNLYWI
jgi:hypothetical protein